MVGKVTIKPRNPQPEEEKEKENIGKWMKKNKDYILIGVGLTTLAFQLIKILKK